MCKLSSFVRGYATKVASRLACRLGVANKTEELIASNPSFARNYLATIIRDVSDADLGRIIAGLEAGGIEDEYTARTYRALKSSGIDVLQELKNEKLLREHRKKHEEMP